MLATTLRDPRSNDALPVYLGKENSNRLVSLWDIVQVFPLQKLLYSLENLRMIESRSERLQRREHGGVRVPDEILEYARTMLPITGEFCEEMNFSSSQESIENLLWDLGTKKEDQEIIDALGCGGPGMPIAEFHAEIRHVRQTLTRELQDHAYVHVQPDRRAYLDQARLFGAKVAKAFPHARFDIRESGNSLAVEANPTTVFHLMRVAEFGLRALAFDRRVKAPKGPLDLSTWEAIIGQLEKAETAIQGYTKTHAREAQFAFYHGAMMELRAFKNVWRNRFMHTREEEQMDRDKAHSVMVHVREFMVILASRIAEGKRTPLVWKRA